MLLVELSKSRHRVYDSLISYMLCIDRLGYELFQQEGKKGLGSPERPLSNEGKELYTTFWRARIAQYMR